MPASTTTTSPDEGLHLYVSSYCGYCVAAERLLETREIPYEKHHLDDRGAREEMSTKTGWRTVPIVLLDGKLIGGYSELRALDASGELQRRLDERGSELDPQTDAG